MRQRPRRLFRRPTDPPARSVSELVARETARIRPGAVALFETVHDPRCRCPQGQRCTCTPTFRFAELLPADN